MRNFIQTRNFCRNILRISAICSVIIGSNAAFAATQNSANAQKSAKTMAQLKAQTRNFSRDKSRKLAQRTAAPNRAVLGKKIPDFTFSDVNGKTRRFSQWRGHPTLFMFVDTMCPCVQAYDSRVKNINAKYAKRGLRVIYVFSQPNERNENIQRFMKNKQFAWTAASDQKQKMLRLFDARCSSEAFLADGNGVLRYHGAFDDSTFDVAAVKNAYMTKAVDAVLAKRAVATPETSALGCAIPRI